MIVPLGITHGADCRRHNAPEAFRGARMRLRAQPAMARRERSAPPDFPLLHAALSVPPCHLLFSAASSSPSRWVGGAAANAPPASVRRVSARGALSSGRLVTPLRVEPPDRARCAAPKGRWRRAGEKIHVFVDLLSVLRALRSALPAKLPQ